MPTAIHTTALLVFCFCFLLVTVAGFLAARWQRADLHSLEEWGLAGRRFGTLIVWFLIGGDFYTAYTVIAVPAALYGAGAPGFFAVPYCILAYPLMMMVLPPLWAICHRERYITLSDYVRGRYGNRWLSVAFALTGILATMPYIALQLVGMREVIAALGIHGEWPLIAAFVILAAYTYTSGLRAPAAIAVVKDVMLYIMVIAAIVIIPAKLGGYGAVFARLPSAAPAAVLELLVAGHRLGVGAAVLSAHLHRDPERIERERDPSQCRADAGVQHPAGADRAAWPDGAGRRHSVEG
jgi:SSS family solute:Na+ symporter